LGSTTEFFSPGKFLYSDLTSTELSKFTLAHSLEWTDCQNPGKPGLLTVSEIEAVNVLFIKDERRAEPHLVIGDFDLTEPSGTQFFVTRLSVPVTRALAA